MAGEKTSEIAIRAFCNPRTIVNILKREGVALRPYLSPEQKKRNGSLRKEAFVSGNTRYFTNQKCKHGHISGRRVSNTKCIECEKIESEIRQENLTKSNKLLPEFSG